MVRRYDNMLPDKVNIAGIEYKVKEVLGLEQKHGLLGQVLYSITEIEIDNRLSKARKEQVFVHELLHACFYEAGYAEQEEDVVNRVSAVLYQVLKDNNICFGGKVVETDNGKKMMIY
jgi:predicted metallopeptidase